VSWRQTQIQKTNQSRVNQSCTTIPWRFSKYVSLCNFTISNIPKTAVLRILTGVILWNKVNCRWILHSLTINREWRRTNMTIDLIELLNYELKTTFERFITGENSWIYLYNFASSIWKLQYREISLILKRKID
jgi:hypothetical protein